MTPEELMAELIVGYRMPWYAAEKLIRAAAWLRVGAGYIKQYPGPARMDCLVLRREGEGAFDNLIRH